MEFGKLEYVIAGNGAGNSSSGPRKLRLTLVGQGDEDVLRARGLAELRRRRILRLAEEAHGQGCMLCYEDLSGLLLTSLATLKRDVSLLEKNGRHVPLKGRRKNGAGPVAPADFSTAEGFFSEAKGEGVYDPSSTEKWEA